MYKINCFDNGFLLVNLRGYGLGFGSVYFPTIEELSAYLIKNVKDHM